MAGKMLRTAVLVPRMTLLLRATNKCPIRQVSAWLNYYLRSSTKPTTLMQRAFFMSESSVSLTAFPIKPKVDGKRQRFSVFFDEEGTTYRLEVSAPKQLSFEVVWQSVGNWLKHGAEHQWSEENLEFIHKAVGRAANITLLGLFKEKGMPIIPVASEEQAEYLSERCGDGSSVWDIGGSLTELQHQLEFGDEKNLSEFQGPLDLESDIGNGIKIRLCNSIFAAKSSLEG